MVEQATPSILWAEGTWTAPSGLLSSGEFMQEIWAALERGEARQALDLARYLQERLPGHLEAIWAEARAWEALGERDLARAVCEAILQRDPEHAEARRVLEGYLEGMPADSEDREGLRAFLKAAEETAIRLEALERLWQQGDLPEALPLAEDLTELPKGMLILACVRMEMGRDVEGTALFHDALVQEPSLSIARRLLQGHPLEAFLLEPMVPWPERESAVPVLAGGHSPGAKVATPADAGDSLRPQEPSHSLEGRGPSLAPAASGEGPSQADPLLREMQAELERIAETLLEREASPLRVQGRRAPTTLLLVTSRKGLERAFRSEGSQAVLERLWALGAASEARGESARLLLVDDAEAMAPFPPADPADPAAVKRLLLQVKKALEETGHQPRYVLLVGGHRVVPPFCLSNPAEDDDGDLWTDGPYACPEGEVLLPHWAVGRLPDAESPRPDILLRLLDSLIQVRREENGHRRGFLGLLRAPWQKPRGDGARPLPSLGFSASLWREASRAVYAALADPKGLRMSPPLTYQHLGTLVAERPAVAYFNLHGLPESQCWYGQRDPLFRADYPPFPLALRPADVDERFQGSVVFTAACYGALCWGHQAENRLATRFLLAGARALVGSTATSYGSLAPPVACADLLALHLLDAVTAGYPVGDALCYAKRRLAWDMMERQGYLDGEDQKTLLTFTLYGDPSLPARGREGPVRSLEFPQPEVVLACNDGACGHVAPAHLADLAPKLLQEIRGMLADRLPDMQDAEVEVKSRPICRRECEKGRTRHPKRPPTQEPALILSLRKRMRDDGYEHDLRLRVTAQANGQVLKVTLCR
ncbi:MAG: hypothetical protein ACUVS5_09490 [Anaerolineae bacterium]